MSKRGASQPTGTTRDGLLVTYNVPDVPHDVARSVRRCFKTVEPYAPRWLRSVRVMFESKPDEAEREYVLQFLGEFEYERATLVVFPQWLDFDENRRREAFVHEFGHALTEPWRDVMCAAIDVLAPPDAPEKKEARELLLTMTKRAQETVAEDIKQAILAAERGRR